MSEVLEFNTGSGKKVKIDGSVYTVRKPSIKEARDIAIRVTDNPNDMGNVDVMIDVLAHLGIPKDLVEKLDMEQASSLLNLVMPKKKD